MPSLPPASPILCSNCAACCCRLEVLLLAGDDVPSRFSTFDEWGAEVMARGEDGWCLALDRDTMRCTIYSRRPGVCREYPEGGDDCRVERARHGIGV
jgi:Fe-S-cluster containining protein